MIDVKLLIRDDKGKEIEVSHQYGGHLAVKSLDEIEAFISKVKGDVLPASEHALLKELQAADIKKKQAIAATASSRSKYAPCTGSSPLPTSATDTSRQAS
jgi:hypothetical protein